MMPRDFRRTGRWHRLTTGDTGSALYFSSGPILKSLSETSAIIRWTLNAPATGYIQWAYTAAALGTTSGWTNSPGETTPMTIHEQSITGLAQATTYWYRVISTDASGNTLTSGAQSFTTTGTTPPINPPGDIGPRYDFYGAGAGGNFPALPVAWDDSTVSVVPTNVTTASALASFILNVTDGVDAAHPRYIVFDNSGGGTAYGAGKQYDLDACVDLANVGGVKRHLVFWGYNAKLRFYGTWSDRSLIWMVGGAWDDVTIRGLEVEADGVDGSISMRDGSVNEWQDGIRINAWRDLNIWDCWFHHTSNFLYLSSYFGSAHNFSAFPYSDRADIGWCLFEDSMNQGLVINAGHNVTVHDSIVTDCYQQTVDMEEASEAPSGNPNRVVSGITFRDCLFARWGWQTDLISMAICLTQTSDYIDRYENITVERCEFSEGPAGNKLGASWPVEQTANQKVPIDRRPMALGAPHPIRSAQNTTAPIFNLVVKDNITTLDQWCIDGSGVYSAWMHISHTTGLSVTGNSFDTLKSVVRDNCTGITWTNNDASYDSYSW